MSSHRDRKDPAGPAAKSGVLLSSFVCAGLAGPSAASAGVGDWGSGRWSGGARTWSSRLARAARPTPPTDASRVGQLCDNIVGRPQVDGQPSADDRWPGRGATATPGGLLLEV